MNLQTEDRLVVPKCIARLVQHHAIYLRVYEKGIEKIAENMIGTGVLIVSSAEFLKNVIEVTRVERFTGSESEKQYVLQFPIALVGTNYDLLHFKSEH